MNGALPQETGTGPRLANAGVQVGLGVGAEAGFRDGAMQRLVGLHALTNEGVNRVGQGGGFLLE